MLHETGGSTCPTRLVHEAYNLVDYTVQCEYIAGVQLQYTDAYVRTPAHTNQRTTGYSICIFNHIIGIERGQYHNSAQ